MYRAHKDKNFIVCNLMTLFLITASAFMLAGGPYATAQTKQSGINTTQLKNSVDSNTRIISFPEDPSLGRIYICDVSPSYEWWWGRSPDWQFIGEAVGKISIPKGKLSALIASSDGIKDLSPLTKLKPDDLDILVIEGERKAADKPGDKCLPFICNLTGLKTLILRYSGISSEGLKSLTEITSLSQLSFISEQLDDTGLANIAEIKSLKGLRFYSEKITNEGLSHLVKLDLLEELFPSSRNIDVDCLVHIAKLPILRYIVLSNKNFCNQEIIHLKELSSLRKLDFISPQISYEWLESMSKLSQLEELAIQNAALNDDYFAPLKSLSSLKKLRLQRGFRGDSGNNFTDISLAALSQIKSLESLELYYGHFTDKGLERLSELNKLRTLVIPNCHSFTDAGLEYLIQLANLEHLNIGSGGLTDDGMVVIGQLTSLKELKLFNNRYITNRGLSRLAGLNSLEKLDLWVPKVTANGLNHLNTLSNLTKLVVQGGYAKDKEPDDTVLNIENLDRIEQLQVPVFCNEDLACLAKLSNLRRLEIDNRGVLTNKGIAKLKSLTYLNVLEITNAHLTDDGLKHISDMKKLDSLTISGDITEQGLHHLEGLKALTYLRIITPKNINPEAIQRLIDIIPNLPRIQTETRELSKVPVRLLQVGQKLSDFNNIDIELSPEDNKGKMILICFWDMNQRSSRNCLQQLSKWANDLKKKDVVVIAVLASKVEQAKLDEWIKDNNIPFPVGMIKGDEEKVRFNWGVQSLPWLILTDKKHIVRADGFNINGLDEKITMIREK